MKKAHFFAPLIALLMIACGESENHSSKEGSLKKQNRELVRSAIEKNKEIREYEHLLFSLEERIKRIRERNIPLAVSTGNEEFPQGSFEAQLTMIENFLDRSRYDLALMKEEVLRQEREITASQEQMVSMREHLEDQFELVDELQNHLTDKNIELGLKEQHNEKLSVDLAAKDRELKTAWFAFGTFEELKQKEVAEKKGGILGIGATKSLTAEFNKEYFTEIDISKTNRIPILSHKAEIITNHPRDSYEIVGDDKIEYIEIHDPERFWKVSKYLAVVVK